MEEEIAEVVRKHGWYAASIYDGDPPFLYTIGLMQTCNHPELIVFGLEANNAHDLFSELIQDIHASKPLLTRGVFTLSSNEEHRIGIRTVHPTQHQLYLGFAMGYCRYTGRPGDLQALQVFWPDAGGKFPFEVGCDLDVFRLQPRLDLPLTPSEIEDFERRSAK